MGPPFLGTCGNADAGYQVAHENQADRQRKAPQFF
jgi:hypothetical protein